MKTFNKSDLITWYNCDQAEIGKEYYFASCLSDIQNRVNDGKCKFKLRSIDENRVDQPFECDDRTCFCWACILPVDKVIEKEPEKKFRPLKNIEEFYKLIFYTEGKSEEQCIYELLSDGYIIHLRNKKTEKEYYSKIANIVKDEEDYILITCAGYSLLDLFNTFDIKINGEWLPFGIPEE